MILDPEDPLLERRHLRFRQLAGVAALGFLLLLPLQLSAGLRQQSAVGSELNATLIKLRGPVLGPADLANPLPLLKAQVNAVFDQAQAQINRDRNALPPTSAATALPELLRTSLACLLFATAFAAFAVRPGSELSLLAEGQENLRRLRFLGQRRLQRPGKRSEADYIREIAGEEES